MESGKRQIKSGRKEFTPRHDHQLTGIPFWEKVVHESYLTEVGKLEFSFRVQWRLYHAGYKKFEQLRKATDVDLLSIPGFGKKSLDEVHGAINELDEKIR